MHSISLYIAKTIGKILWKWRNLQFISKRRHAISFYLVFWNSKLLISKSSLADNVPNVRFKGILLINNCISYVCNATAFRMFLPFGIFLFSLKNSWSSGTNIFLFLITSKISPGNFLLFRWYTCIIYHDIVSSTDM